MTVNEEQIRKVNTEFDLLFNNALASGETPPISEIASVVQSKTSAKTYPSLLGVPKMREMVDEAKIQNFIASSYTVQNKDFEATVEVPENEISDDNLGIYEEKIIELGTNARAHPWELLIDLINVAFTGQDYTGTPFISNNKPFVPGVGKKLPNPTFSNKGTKTLTRDSLKEAIAFFREMKDPYGNKIYKGRRIIPTLLVPSALEFDALELVAKAETKNALYGAAKVKVVVGLDNQKCWFLADLDSGVKPFIYQERQAARMISNASSLADGIVDTHFIKTHMLLFQANARGNMAFGASSRIWGSDGSTAG